MLDNTSELSGKDLAYSLYGLCPLSKYYSSIFFNFRYVNIAYHLKPTQHFAA